MTRDRKLSIIRYSLGFILFPCLLWLLRAGESTLFIPVAAVFIIYAIMFMRLTLLRGADDPGAVKRDVKFDNSEVDVRTKSTNAPASTKSSTNGMERAKSIIGLTVLLTFLLAAIAWLLLNGGAVPR
jgi:hypothetical protein